MVTKDAKFHEKVDICNEIVQIRLYSGCNFFLLTHTQHFSKNVNFLDDLIVQEEGRPALILE